LVIDVTFSEPTVDVESVKPPPGLEIVKELE
jgi:hypothetical protein